MGDTSDVSPGDEARRALGCRAADVMWDASGVTSELPESRLRLLLEVATGAAWRWTCEVSFARDVGGRQAKRDGRGRADGAVT